MAEYLKYLPAAHHKAVSISAYPRDIYVKADGVYIFGLVVTIKDQRKYCELVVQSGGNQIIDVKNLAQNSKLMEFNFFVIDKKTGAGVFQHYHNSLSLSGLGYFFATTFGNLNKATIDAEINKLPIALQSKKNVEAIKKSKRDRLNFKIAIRKEGLRELLEELKTIKSFEYEFATLGVVEKEMRQLSGAVKKKNTKLIFNAGTSSSSIASKIASSVESLGLTKGSIVGKDGADLESVIRLIDNVGRFSEFDYDDSLQKIASLNINDFDNCWVIEQLRSTLRSNIDFISRI